MSSLGKRKRKRKDDYDKQSESQTTTTTERSSVVPSTVKVAVHNTFQDLCWLCSGSGDDVAHVFPKAEESAFRTFQSRGVIRADSINAMENLLLLCATCHRGFDKTFPAWIFLPTDMETLLADEEAFHCERLAAAAAGETLQRPAKPIVNMSFARYMVRESHFSPLVRSLFRSAPVEPWRGDPACALLRSSAFMSFPHDNEALFTVTPLFLRLLALYTTPAPPVKSASKGKGKSRAGDTEESEAGKGDDTGAARGSGRDTSRAPHTPDHDDEADELADSNPVGIRRTPRDNARKEGTTTSPEGRYSTRAATAAATAAQASPPPQATEPSPPALLPTPEGSTEHERKRRRGAPKKTPDAQPPSDSPQLPSPTIAPDWAFGPQWTSERFIGMWKDTEPMRQGIRELAKTREKLKRELGD